jgi:hypothetical protein
LRVDRQQRGGLVGDELVQHGVDAVLEIRVRA